MDLAKYQYQSEFAKRYYGRGKVEGKVEMLSRLLSLRFGEMSPADQTRLSTASAKQLDAIGDRLITAKTLREALGSKR